MKVVVNFEMAPVPARTLHVLCRVLGHKVQFYIYSDRSL